MKNGDTAKGFKKMNENGYVKEKGMSVFLFFLKMT